VHGWCRVVSTTVIMLACVALGAAVCLAGLVVHRHSLRPLGVVLPWGLLLGLATSYAVIRAANVTPIAVRGSAGCALGWLVFMLLAYRSRPEGDFLVAGDWLGAGFVLGGMAVVVLAVVRSMAEVRT